MKYKIPVTVTRLEDGSYMARCNELRATATGDDPEMAMKNLLIAIRELVEEFGETTVFQDLKPETDWHALEVAL